MHTDMCIPETVFQAFDTRLANQLRRDEVAGHVNRDSTSPDVIKERGVPGKLSPA